MISWVILLAIAVIAVDSVIYRRFVLKRVSYERRFNMDRCFAGDEVELVETIGNWKILPLPWLRIESTIHTGLRFQQQFNLDMSAGTFYQNHRSLFSLMPYTRINRRHQIVCDKRGWYRLHSAAMTAGDMLGIQAAAESLATHAELLVYPRTVPLTEIPLPSHNWLGDITVRRWIVDDPFMIAGVREYRYGDAMNRLNWKATARSGKLQVHNRDYTADPRLMIYVNVEVSETMWSAVTDPELIEKSLSYAATIADYALSLGISAGFGFNGGTVEEPKECVRIESHSGSTQLTAILDTMAKLVIERVLPFDTFLEEDVRRSVSNTDYLLITPFRSEKIDQQIRRLMENGNAVETIIITPEGKQAKEGEEYAG
jgi:uncharacterized protein (DUF58 family)